MLAKVKTALRKIDALTVGLSVEEQRDLWDILSAMRGPDNDDVNLKEQTTCVIRALAFPKITAGGQAMIAGKGSKVADINTALSDNILGGAGHFMSHIHAAERALRKTAKDRD